MFRGRLWRGHLHRWFWIYPDPEVVELGVLPEGLGGGGCALAPSVSSPRSLLRQKPGAGEGRQVNKDSPDTRGEDISVTHQLFKLRRLTCYLSDHRP